MSYRSGRHTRRGANAVPVREFIASAGTLPSPNTVDPLALRRPANVAVALTAATAIAFAPMTATQNAPVRLALPASHVSNIHLAAVISDADIKNLVTTVNSGLNRLDATIANVAGVPGQMLAGALTAASSLTSNFWTTLVSASKSNPLLSNVLSALRAITAGGLARLSATTTSANGAITLSTQQVTSLLTSTLSRAVGTVLYAIANVLNNPLSAMSYAGLVNAPITIVGGVLSNTAAAVSSVGTNGVSLIGDVITGATSQVTNLVAAANDVFSGIKQAIDNQQVNALMTIAQAIVTAPLTAAVSVVNGATSALADAATTAVQVAAAAVQRISTIWLGTSTNDGDLQNIVSVIAAGPLSPASYANVADKLITGAAETVNQVGSAVVAGLLPLPLKASATVVSAASSALNNLADGLASATVSALEFAGVNSLFANTVYGLVGAIKAAVSLTAGTISTALNAVAALATTASSVTGLYNPATATPTAKSLAATQAKIAAVTGAKHAVAASPTSVADDTNHTTRKEAPAESASNAAHGQPARSTDAPTKATETRTTGSRSAKSAVSQTASTDPATAANGKHAAVDRSGSGRRASGVPGRVGK